MPSAVFGLNTCFAVKRWPEPEEWVPIAQSMGVEHVQFSFDLIDPILAGDDRLFHHTREVCEQHGITITSAFTGLISYAQNSLGHPNEAMRERAQEWYRAAIDAAAALGAPGVGGHIGALSVGQFDDPGQRAQAVAGIVDSVRALAEHAAARNLGFLLWEVMPVAREYPSQLDAAEELMATLDGSTAVPVLLCLDMGHACAAGASELDRDPYAWLKRLGSFTQVVHLQQTDGVADRHWPFTAAFNQQGIVDPERVVDLVAGFQRETVELMLEPMFAFEAADAQVLADLRESVAFWEPALQRLAVGGTAAGGNEIDQEKV
jgi:D-erythrulose 1-phosphate 3-epimerase